MKGEVIYGHPYAPKASAEEADIFITGVIGPDYHTELQAQLDRPDVRNAARLIVHMQSRGGSVYAGYNSYHTLKRSGKPITMIIEGEAQSIATFMALAADEVIMKDPSIWMIHMPSTGIEGTADDLEGGLGELRKIEAEMIKAYAEKNKASYAKDPTVTLLNEEQIRGMMKKTTRMSAFEAKQFGFVDKITQYLKAVALGTEMKAEEKKSKLETITGNIAKMLGELIEGAPKAIDLPGNDGKMYHIESENGDLVGKKVTVNGAPAPDGTYDLQDGRKLVCAGGVVTAVEQVMSEEQKAQQALAAAQKQLADLTQKNQAAEAAKVAAEAAKVAAEAAAKEAIEKAGKTATMLGEISKEVEALKKETVGDTNGPDKGTMQNKPIMIGMKPGSTQGVDMARSWIATSPDLQWLHQYYPAGYFDKYKLGGPNNVSIVEPSQNYTWNGILTTDLFYKSTMDTPAINDMVTIDQGITWQKRYNLVQALDKILKPYGGCGAAPNSNRALITNALLQTKEFRMYEGWCKDDFTKYFNGEYTYLANEWLKTGEASFDPAGTPVDTLIQKLITDALRRDVFRRFSFGAGNSSSADYNQIDGLWDRLIDSSSGGQANYCVYRANGGISGVNAFGTGALSAGQALAAFGAMFVNAPYLLKQFINAGKAATLWVTDSLWQNYYDSLVGNGSVSNNQYQALRDGIQKLTYKGIWIRPVPFWDYDLANNSTNPLAATTRHLALLTVKENHIFGVENGADLNKIDSWFEKKDDKRYYRADMKLGYQYLHCDLQVIAY
jgi:ATP-dependent Clp protease protease subunit